VLNVDKKINIEITDQFNGITRRCLIQYLIQYIIKKNMKSYLYSVSSAILNLPISSRSRLAWADSSWLEAELSSAVAALL